MKKDVVMGLHMFNTLLHAIIPALCAYCHTYIIPCFYGFGIAILQVL